MSNIKTKVIIGNYGAKVRSDCQVVLEICQSGGIDLQINSKVNAMFGQSNRELIMDILNFYEINNAKIVFNDSGAIVPVIIARMEAAIKSLIAADKDFLLPQIVENTTISTKDKMRFSRLYLPGNSPNMMLNAGIHKPNGIILDLEDAVAHDKKYEARFMVRNALRNINFYGAERMVRINQIPMGLEDLDYIVPHYVNLILVPKCESAEQIYKVNERISQLKIANNMDYPIWLMPIIESALGVVKAYEIASSADNIAAMAIGLEDYTADLGTLRTTDGTESFYARSAIVNACRAAGIQAIDSVFSDISDMEALAQNVKVSKSLGFDGMGCIHPRQIEVIHQNFAPEENEIFKAKRIFMAFKTAKEQGLGVVSLGTKMIDAPVVKRAENTLKVAINLGIIDKNWEDNFEA